MVVEDLRPLDSERKRGLSTNVVKLSANEYIVGYHNVLKNRGEYSNGFLLLNNEGETTGVTKPILETTGALRYGARPYTLFGCGLVLRKDRLYWVGGIGDTWIGVFSADLDKVLSEVI